MIAVKSLTDLDCYEDALIQRFQQHPCLHDLAILSPTDMCALLLQRRFLSLAFTPVYDMAIDGLTDPKAKQSARRILREEYPGERGTVPSHREDLVSDLLQVGLTRHQIMNAVPSDTTLTTLQRTFALFAGDPDAPNYQIKLLTLLRFWGEVLIAAEYQMLWPRLESMGLQKSGTHSSLFYHPHFIHDAKRKPLTQRSLVGSTHSDLLAVSLQILLDSEEAFQYCAEIETEIMTIKTGFYDQVTLEKAHR